MYHREVTAIAGGVQGGRRLADVLAHDRDVADLAIALAEFVVREANRAGIVSEFSLFQSPAVQRNRAGLITACRCEAAVESPESRQAAGGYRFAQRLGSASQRSRGLVEIILQKPRFGQHA